jgi:tetratricopeptide (TPR) repeat protein
MSSKPSPAALLLALLACRAAPPAPPPDFDAAWSYGDPAASEARFRELAAQHPCAEPDWRLQLQTQIARTYSLRARFAEAHAELDAVERELAAAGPVTRARTLLERGRTHNSAGEPERAVPLFLEAFELARGAGAERHAADALHMLGIAAPPEEGLAWNRRAIEYCEACSDPQARRWLGPLYHNTWFAHLELGDFEQALRYAERSCAFRASIGDEEGERIGRWTIHHTHRRMGRVEEALAGFEALAADYGEDGDPSGYTDEELGECLLALGRPAEAQPRFAAAYARLSQDPLLAAQEPERLARLRELGAAPDTVP